MKRFNLIFVGMILGILIVFGFLWTGSTRKAQAERGQQSTDLTPTPSITANPSSMIHDPVGGNDETPPPGFNKNAPVLNVLPTQIPGETLVYFVPSDNDATGTVLYLYNTDAVAHIVALRGFSYNGVLVYSLNINVGATSFLRLASDSIASAPPPSWATPAPIITNFTDFTYFASLSLPKGVKAEGYEVFNPGTGVVDPRADQGAIPLRFSTDPATLFMPALSN
jgi:hypothetical protein